MVKHIKNDYRFKKDVINMKRFISVLLLITIIITFGSSSIAVAETGVISVFLDGKRLSFDVPPIIIDGRTLVPMRKIFEELGYTVSWNKDKQRITAVKGELSVQLDIGDTLAIFDNYESAAQLDVPAQIIDGRTMVPLRFVATAANYDVLWDAISNTIHIESKVLYSGFVRENQPIFIEDDVIYYKEGETAYKISLDGSVFEETTKEDIDKMLYARTDIDFPEGALRNDYVISDNRLYYNDDLMRLFELDLNTKEKTLICEQYNFGFDVSDGKVYYSSANYSISMSIWPPASHNGIFCYDIASKTSNKILDAPAFEVRASGSNLYYSATHYSDETSNYVNDLHRYSLANGYDLTIISEFENSRIMSAVFTLSEKYIFYYAMGGVWRDDTPQGQYPQMYIASTDGTGSFPVAALMFANIAWLEINGNVPDAEHFNEYLQRDLNKYFSNRGAVEYILLRTSPSQVGVGYPHYYAWVTVLDESGIVATEGAVRLNAINKKVFAVTDFVAKEQILEDARSVTDLFPLILHKRIFELAGL